MNASIREIKKAPVNTDAFLVELVGTRSLAACLEIYILQASLHLKFLLRIATGNPHPLGAVPYQFIQKKPSP
jgi:hypothetical protein